LAADPTADFRAGFDRIRADLAVPGDFSAAILSEADRVADSVLADLFAPVDGERPVDRRDVDFVTLDPAQSIDLDQAFTIETDADDVVLSYAIADVARFVVEDGEVDQEAWRRGVTVYLPDQRATLYPPRLADDAASLLPDVDRAAIVFRVRISPDGAVVLAGVERAVVRSRAKLAYATVTLADLPPGFTELAQRIERAEAARGADRIEAPEQEVVRSGSGFVVQFRPRSAIERQSAALSLATNLAVADQLLAARTGLFRTMHGIEEAQLRRLRHIAKAFGLDWPAGVPLRDYLRTLSDDDPRTGAFQLAVRRSGGSAGYEPYRDGVVPWHAAVAATYCHATAPLRRLGDRYVIEAARTLAAGRPVPSSLTDAFERLPGAIGPGETLAKRADRAALDLAEAIVLHGREGDVFDAVVTDEDERGVQLQIAEPATVARVAAHQVDPGDRIRVRLTRADPVTRTVEFARVS
jgi:exoribonuclease R